jgi:hypothetical protein
MGPQILRPMVAYLERLEGTLARSSVQGTASELAHFGRFLARVDPRLSSLALLTRKPCNKHARGQGAGQSPVRDEVPKFSSRWAQAASAGSMLTR